MAEQPERSSKTEAPSQRKLDEARRRGDVAKSPEVAPFAALAAATAVLLLQGPALSRAIADALVPFLDHPERIDLHDRGGGAVLTATLQAGAPVLMVLVAAMAGGVAGNVVQHGVLWAPSKLAPDLAKLNPLSGFGRVFGPDGLGQFVKSTAKLVSVTAAAFFVLRPRAMEFGAMAALDPAALLGVTVDLLRALAIAVLIFLALTAGLDWLWQRQRFMARMRMTREESKQDAKDSDGDPHVRARQRQIRADRAKRRMMQAVPKATVVIMNPTHYAVALRYVSGETAAPLCVAKGVDSLALKIREVAEGAGVPVIEDPPLARALYAAIDVDQAIPREHYEAVAKVIGFVMRGAKRWRASERAPQARAGL